PEPGTRTPNSEPRTPNPDDAPIIGKLPRGERKKARPLCRSGPGADEPDLEVEGEVEPHEPRAEDRRRVEPGPAVRRSVVVLRFEDRPVIRVEQVLEIDADVQALPVEPEDLREPHVDL